MNKLFIYKYQPCYLKEFEIERENIELLETYISMDNLNIIFIGDGGSGKTSFIQSLIKEYYIGENETSINDNILYINSLKEQGINYYRNEVKTFCQTCSFIKNKKKIIVLDDIDITLNEQCQQVFRNFIDKYNHNVHFIASCSNIQKVIENIQSRLNPIKLHLLHKNNLQKIMNKIIINENIKIDKNAQEFVLNVSNNSVKVLINYMEKFKLLGEGETITLELANDICTNISFYIFNDYIHYLRENELYKAIELLYEISEKGYSVMDILDTFFLYIKTTDILNENEKYTIIPLICKYITIFHDLHEDDIELALFTNNLYMLFHKQTDI